jgi:hypothetical protein
MWHLHFGWFIYRIKYNVSHVLSLKSVIINSTVEFVIVAFFVNDTLSP